MTATITFYSIILCQAQCSVPHMNLSSNPCSNPTSGTPELAYVRNQKRPYSGFLEARGRGEDSAGERAVQKW